jgi:hypothetical protein
MVNNKNIGTIKNLKINKNFKTSYGTINKKSPASLYINVAGWLNIKSNKPTINDVNEKMKNSKMLLKRSKAIKQTIYDNLNRKLFIDDRTILVSDIAVQVPSNKPNFYNYEVSLYQKNNKPLLISNPAIQSEIIKISNIIIEILQKQENVKYTRTK